MTVACACVAEEYSFGTDATYVKKMQYIHIHKMAGYETLHRSLG